MLWRSPQRHPKCRAWCREGSLQRSQHVWVPISRIEVWLAAGSLAHMEEFVGDVAGDAVGEAIGQVASDAAGSSRRRSLERGR